jgi:hypothetical protein
MHALAIVEIKAGRLEDLDDVDFSRRWNSLVEKIV